MAKQNNPVGPLTAQRILDSLEFTEGFKGDNVRRVGKSVYVGSSGGKGGTASPDSDKRHLVRITGRAGVGKFNCQQVKWDKSEGAFVDVDGGFTDSDITEIVATGWGPTSGAGLVYAGDAGDIVTIRPSLIDRGDGSGKTRWEFTPGCKTMPVDVVQVGGADGTDSSAATWTYNVYAEDGEILLEAATPQNKRPSAGQVQAADHGYVHYELVAGIRTLTLGWVNEGPEGPSVDNEGYNAAEAASSEVIDNPTPGGTGSQSDDGTLQFRGIADTAWGQTQTDHIPVRSYVHDEVVAMAETGTTFVDQWIDPDDLPIDPNTQGFETVTDGATSVSEADGGIVEFDTATGLGSDEYAVEFEVADNSPTAKVTGKVNLSSFSGGGGGPGSDEGGMYWITIDANTADATEIELDAADWRGRMIRYWSNYEVKTVANANTDFSWQSGSGDGWGFRGASSTADTGFADLGVGEGTVSLIIDGGDTGKLKAIWDNPGGSNSEVQLVLLITASAQISAATDTIT